MSIGTTFLSGSCVSETPKTEPDIASVAAEKNDEYKTNNKKNKQNRGGTGFIRVTVGGGSSPALMHLTIDECSGTSDTVVHVQHSIDATLMETARRLLQQLDPSMMLIYKNVQHVGTYPLNSDNTISKLAYVDRTRFETFVASCRIGDVGPALVTKLNHLSTFADLPQEHLDVPFAHGIANAFLFPCESVGVVQMSAQFKPVTIANHNKILCFRLCCKEKQHRDVIIKCTEVYDAFCDKCAEIKRYATVIRGVLEATKTARLETKSTRLAGHKLFIPLDKDKEELLTLYITRSVVVCKNAPVDRLTIVAADIRIQMLQTEDLVDASEECVVCFEPMDTQRWHCSMCKNSLHEACLHTWKANGGSACPFCRRALPYVAAQPSPPHETRRTR